MEPLTELMLNIKGMVENQLKISLNLTELPKDGGVYAELGPSTTKKYLRGPGLTTCSVLFMCKNSVEPDCLDQMSKIANYFSHLRRLPDGISYQFRGLTVASGPHKTGRTEDGQPVYSSIINFQISY